MDEVWDTIIIGAGSAGMAAAIYAARFNLKVLVIGKEVGGLLNESHNVENYPGYKSITGIDLMLKFKEHMDNLDVPTKTEWVTEVKAENYDDPKKCIYNVITDKGEYKGKTIIFTNGTKHRKLNAKGEEALSGKGVSYCATCDAAFYKNIPVAIVGGGDSAALAGQLVSEFASKVYVIVRKNKMRAEPINLQRLEKNEKVEILYETEVEEILGENLVEKIILSKEYNGSKELPVEGVFIEIGQIIQSELAEKMGVTLNERKEIIINENSETNLRGVYAAGDVGNKEYKQALTGASEGAIAAFAAYALLQKIHEGEDVDVRY
ncbi:MAG: FAD-dependent oxidoreductase [Candidatus Woesearchaeota archaeon]|nr:FAD-dependent oxidoreductase [Candidatus Woesearchaeota archaeon]